MRIRSRFQDGRLSSRWNTAAAFIFTTIFDSTAGNGQVEGSGGDPDVLGA